jgi:hypothetical protein
VASRATSTRAEPDDGAPRAEHTAERVGRIAGSAFDDPRADAACAHGAERCASGPAPGDIVVGAAAPHVSLAPLAAMWRRGIFAARARRASSAGAADITLPV